MHNVEHMSEVYSVYILTFKSFPHTIVGDRKAKLGDTGLYTPSQSNTHFF